MTLHRHRLDRGAWPYPQATREGAAVVQYRDGPWQGIAHASEYAEGPSAMPGADHVREGAVVRPAEERWHPEAGRVVLKLIGRGYLARKAG